MPFNGESEIAAIKDALRSSSRSLEPFIANLKVDRRWPIGPKGQRRPAAVIGATVMVGKIAKGEIDDVTGVA
jgi:hypothetical protein